MADNPYENIIRMMQTQGAVNNSAEVQIGIMTGPDSCKIGDLELDKKDLLFNELLIHPQLRNVYNSSVTESGSISVSCVCGGGSYNLNSSSNSLTETNNEWTDQFKLKAGDIVAVTRVNADTYAVLGRLVRV